jgi:hypothetical protein
MTMRLIIPPGRKPHVRVIIAFDAMNKWGAPRNESSTPRREGLACGVMSSFCAGPDDEGHWRVQGFTAGRLIRMQCAYVTETEARQDVKGRRPP